VAGGTGSTHNGGLEQGLAGHGGAAGPGGGFAFVRGSALYGEALSAIPSG